MCSSGGEEEVGEWEPVRRLVGVGSVEVGRQRGYGSGQLVLPG